MSINNRWGKKLLIKLKNKKVPQRGCQNYLWPVNRWVTQIIGSSREMLPSSGHL